MVRKIERRKVPHPAWEDARLDQKFGYTVVYGIIAMVAIFAFLRLGISLSVPFAWVLSNILTVLLIIGVAVYLRSRRRRIMKGPSPLVKKIIYYLIISAAIIIMGVLIGAVIFHKPDPEKSENSLFMFRFMMANGAFIVLVFLIAYIYLSKKETIRLEERTEGEKINNGQIYEIYKDVLKGRFVDISQLRAYLPSDENGVLDRLLDELVEHQEALRGKQGNIDKNGLEYLLVFAGTLLFSTNAGIKDIGEFYDEVKTNKELHSEKAIIKLLKDYIEIFQMPPAIFFIRIKRNLFPLFI